MKAALNGVVNTSILDGWWCEGYSPETGFAIGGDAIAATKRRRTRRDAAALFAVLEQQVIPAYYDRGAWLDLMRNSIARLGARFNTNRMVVEYVETPVSPGAPRSARPTPDRVGSGGAVRGRSCTSR